jgi:cold shock CspA family protein
VIGTVRWYSGQGYGFIDPIPASADGAALYYHISGVQNRAVFKAGDAVSFDVVSSPKGSKCVNVRAAKTESACETKEATDSVPARP